MDGNRQSGYGRKPIPRVVEPEHKPTKAKKSKARKLEPTEISTRMSPITQPRPNRLADSRGFLQQPVHSHKTVLGAIRDGVFTQRRQSIVKARVPISDQLDMSEAGVPTMATYPGAFLASDSPHRGTLITLVVFMTMMLNYCLVSAFAPIAPAYLGLDNSAAGSISQLGFVIGANAGAQAICSVMAGRLVDRMGAVAPYSAGFVVMFISTCVMAIAADISWQHRYSIVMVCRILQGAGSSLAATGGMAWLMSEIADEDDRSKAVAIATSGNGAGIVVGLPIASAFAALGAFTGWKATFLLFNTLLVLTGLLFIMCLDGERTQRTQAENNTNIRSFLAMASDPYIVQVACLAFLSNIGMATVFSTFPSWITMVLNAPLWSLGLLFLAAELPYIIVPLLLSKVPVYIGQYWFMFYGNQLLGIGIFMIPHLIYWIYLSGLPIGLLVIPLLVLGVGVALSGSVAMPVMVAVMKKRHSVLIGSSCAIINASWSLASFLGPFTINAAIDRFSFQWIYVALSQVVFFSSFTIPTLKDLLD